MQRRDVGVNATRRRAVRLWLSVALLSGCPTPPPAVDPDAERSASPPIESSSADPRGTHASHAVSAPEPANAPQVIPKKPCAPAKAVVGNRRFALSANACKGAVVCHEDADGCEVCGCGDTHNPDPR